MPSELNPNSEIKMTIDKLMQDLSEKGHQEFDTKGFIIEFAKAIGTCLYNLEGRIEALDKRLKGL